MGNTNDCKIADDYKKTLDKYKYCRSEIIKDNENDYAFYHEIIKKYIDNSHVITKNKKDKNTDEEEIDFELMELLNWIALWKTNRIIELNSDAKEIRELLIDLHKLKKDDKNNLKEDDKNNTKIREVLRSLLESKKGIDLPMASTIMHFFNPKLCPIIDRRADRFIFAKWNELRKIGYEIDGPGDDDFKLSPTRKDIDWKIDYYIIYRNRCIKFCEKNDAKMESIDRFLYQKDKDSIKGLGKYQIGQWLDNK